jgi:hypothetical protein
MVNNGKISAAILPLQFNWAVLIFPSFGQKVMTIVINFEIKPPLMPYHKEINPTVQQ